MGPQVRGWGGSRQALGLNHPGLPAMALLSSDEMRMKPTLTLERVCPSAHLGGDFHDQVHVSDAELEAESGEITRSG